MKAINVSTLKYHNTHSIKSKVLKEYLNDSYYWPEKQRDFMFETLDQYIKNEVAIEYSIGY